MPKYKVEWKEIVHRSVYIDAESESEARQRCDDPRAWERDPDRPEDDYEEIDHVEPAGGPTITVIAFIKEGTRYAEV